jgi:putative ABC transport system substrate-binding protein
VRRRDFITLLGGAAAGWPLTAQAQQQLGRTRRVGVLWNLLADDAESQNRYAAFLQALAELGWVVGRNLRIDVRWGPGNDLYRKSATELNALGHDVILTVGTPPVAALQQAGRTGPIVFVGVSDPVGAGLVASLARPGGNVTGFAFGEFGFVAKWPELLKQIAPGMTRAAVLRDATNSAEIAQFAAMQSMAPLLGLELNAIDVRDAAQIERSITAFVRGPNDGLIVAAGGQEAVHRDLIIKLASQNRLPAVYSDRLFVTAGGLISYGTDRLDQLRSAAGYVDRILKGEKPADLPVQTPTKYETVINLRTAKALGLDIPATVLVRADEVIE